MDGVSLCARFSLATNRLRYCGPADAEPALYRAIVDGGPIAPARTALARFEALTPYLEAIAAPHGLDPFDERVIEAYWIGNELLDGFPRKGFVTLLDALRRRGLPRSLATRLSENLPEAPVPHHLFHVVYVGVGNVTGHVATTLETIEACRPSWGTVTAIDSGSLLLARPSLRAVPDGYAMGPTTDARVDFDPAVLPTIGVGSTVAVHWSWAAVELTAANAEALARYSAKALTAANEGLRRLARAR